MNWNLSILYTGFDDPAIAKDEKRMADGLKAIDEAIVSPRTPAENLRVIVETLQDVVTAYGAYGDFVLLTLAADAKCEPAVKMRDKVMRMGMGLSQTMSAFSRYLGGLENLPGIIESDPLLSEHSFVLREMGERARHTIDPALEGPVLEMQLNGGSAFANLRDQLDANHMVPYRGKSLPLSAIRNLAYDSDPAVRKSAYEAELAAYPAIETPMAACLNAIKGEALTLCRLKKYDSVLDMTLAESRMDRETLDTMLSAIRESLPRLREILKAKARALGHKNGLPFYDLFAPMGKSGEKRSLADAREMLVQVMGEFSPRMAKMIARAFDERWIDAYPREGKSGGAFCAECGRTKTSFILTNFDGMLGDVSTLAHELGHAFHNECLYARSPLNVSTPMPLAETASTFNEIVFSRVMMAQADSEAKLQILDQSMADAVQVLVDILSRYLFETEVIRRRATQEMTPRELCEIMKDAQLQTYGDGLDPDFLHPYMWACKSHYYSTNEHFYNFPYAFGMLFGRGVYARYEREGASFEPAYEKLLSSTGMMTIYDAARSAGIDLHDPAFWHSSIENVLEDAGRYIRLLDGSVR